ncbi:hypothetical protein ACFPMF_19885 [Larkinella bovis]|uniref:Uncharacterized protein n=1 Tax=Larkinella bovis TaxID=683041 RepID=A0ABW0IKB4_9BACT
MYWKPTHFPAAMRSLSPSVRAKAIEIANRLQLQGEPDQKTLISTSIMQARQWNRQRFLESQDSSLR